MLQLYMATISNGFLDSRQREASVLAAHRSNQEGEKKFYGDILMETDLYNSIISEAKSEFGEGNYRESQMRVSKIKEIHEVGSYQVLILCKSHFGD